MKKITCGKEFLEIGPGNLNLTKELLFFFKRGVVIDFNPAVQEIYKGLPPSIKNRISLKIEDIMTASIEHTFDCIVACEVMEHVREDEAFLRKIFCLLKPGGQAILSVPAKWKYWSVHDNMVGHYQRYEFENLSDLLSQFSNKVEIISYGFPFINLLWFLRVLHTKLCLKRRALLSYDDRTRKSGFSDYGLLMDFCYLLLNKYTILPLAMISSIFNHFDLSEGYLVFIEK